MAVARISLRPDFAPRVAAPRDRGARVAGIAAAVGFHLLLIIALLQYAPARRSLAQMAPIMVSLITPPAPQVLPPPPPPVKPRRVVTQDAPAPIAKLPEPPAVVSEAATVSPITLPPPAPIPPQPEPVAQAVIAPEPPPPPAPIIPPRFNADYLQNPAPPYPALARRMREQGRVLVRVLVSVEGAPERIELKASSGFARLDQSALDTIRNWKFVPARQGEQKVAAWVLVPINFALDA